MLFFPHLFKSNTLNSEKDEVLMLKIQRIQRTREVNAWMKVCVTDISTQDLADKSLVPLSPKTLVPYKQIQTSRGDVRWRIVLLETT